MLDYLQDILLGQSVSIFHLSFLSPLERLVYLVVCELMCNKIELKD